MAITVDDITTSSASESITALALITISMQDIGVAAKGESLDAADAKMGLDTLNSMLAAWGTEGLLRPALVKENFPLVVSQGSYTIGPLGDFDTVRPLGIVRAFTRDSSGYDYPTKPMTEQEYDRLTVKTTAGRPYAYLYDPQTTLGVLYLYYVPDATDTLYIESIKSFTKPATLTATLAIEPEIKEALEYNLAKRLAPKFGQSISPDIAALAVESYQRVKKANSKPVVITDFGFGPGNSSFNIYTGE